VKRQYRLRRPKDFQRVRSKGNLQDDARLTITVAPARQRLARCGIVVARRHGGAVVRNRIKRRIKEAIRLQYAHIKGNVDLVFVVKSRALQALPFPKLLDLVASLLRRAGVYTQADDAATE
jgi:ribonuclease P protein component